MIRTGKNTHTLSLDWGIKVKQSISKAETSAKIEKLDSFQDTLPTPRRWPGELDYDILVAEAADRAKRRQKYYLSDENGTFTKILKVAGKVLLYATFGLFIISFMIIASVLEDSAKSSRRKR